MAMTNRQWIDSLTNEELGHFLGSSDCPPGNCECIAEYDGCQECWSRWLGEECAEPVTAFYDIVEEHHGCFVQVLANSVTGEMSIGWREE